MLFRSEETFAQPVEFMADFDGIVVTEPPPKKRLRYWLGKIIQFPIGERWLVISASAVIGGAAFTFTIMPILAAISAIIVYRGRIILTRKMPKTSISKPLITYQSDLLGVRRSFTKRFDWIEPSLLRLCEVGFLIWVFSSVDKIGIPTYLIIFSVIFHHYDNLYRALQGEKKPHWLSALGLFVGGRILVLGVATFQEWPLDRKSTRLNSSHEWISRMPSSA